MFGDARLPERFWSKVLVSDSGCWEWQGSLRFSGYGQFRFDGRARMAHRVSFACLVGGIRDDLTLDHLCRNRACVNPAHLEQVTRGENVLRGIGFAAEKAKQTHCEHGHPLSGDNLHTIPRRASVQRICIACRRRRRIESYARNRDAERSRMKSYYQSNKEKWK